MTLKKHVDTNHVIAKTNWEKNKLSNERSIERQQKKKS